MAQTDQQLIDAITEKDFFAEAGIFGSTVGQNSEPDDRGKITFEANGATPPATTTAGSAGSNSSSGDKPGKRPYNPLSKLSSYTYNLTLYMITPDTYKAFVASGRKNISALNRDGSGAYIVAQSAGVNNKSERRAPNFELDHYIDNLKLNTTFPKSGSGSNGTTNLTTCTFDIYEPYGFSFITKLRKARDAIMTGPAANMEPIKQFFILGIRFQGYDSKGNPITKENDLNENFYGSTGSGGIFEHFYDISIKEMKFKLDGKMSVYRCSASGVAEQSIYNLERGIVNTNVEFEGATVNEALTNFFKKLTQEEKRVKNENRSNVPNTYKHDYVTPFPDFQNSPLVNAAHDDHDKNLSKANRAQTSAQSNVGLNNNTESNINKRVIKIKNGTPIVQAIQEIVKLSDFYRKSASQAVKATETGGPGGKPDVKVGSTKDKIEENKKDFTSYTVAPHISEIYYDSKRESYVYDITYKISQYMTPNAKDNVSYVDNATKYYGPYKRYEWIWTGQNSEIINLSFKMDNLFHQVALSGDGIGDKSKGAKHVNAQTSVAAKTGSSGNSLDTANAAITYLKDPGAVANVKINILGDPDWLVQTTYTPGSSLFYGANGYSPNPMSGQLFLEVDFYEPIDYNHAKGLMDLNKNIQFWEYPTTVKGLSFLLRTIESMFSGGKFTQTLDVTINDNAYRQGQSTQTSGNLTPDVASRESQNGSDDEYGIGKKDWDNAAQVDKFSEEAKNTEIISGVPDPNNDDSGNTDGQYWKDLSKRFREGDAGREQRIQDAYDNLGPSA